MLRVASCAYERARRRSRALPLIAAILLLVIHAQHAVLVNATATSDDAASIVSVASISTSIGGAAWENVVIIRGSSLTRALAADLIEIVVPRLNATSDAGTAATIVGVDFSSIVPSRTQLNLTTLVTFTGRLNETLARDLLRAEHVLLGTFLAARGEYAAVAGSAADFAVLSAEVGVAVFHSVDVTSPTAPVIESSSPTSPRQATDPLCGTACVIALACTGGVIVLVCVVAAVVLVHSCRPAAESVEADSTGPEKDGLDETSPLEPSNLDFDSVASVTIHDDQILPATTTTPTTTTTIRRGSRQRNQLLPRRRRQSLLMESVEAGDVIVDGGDENVDTTLNGDDDNEVPTAPAPQEGGDVVFDHPLPNPIEFPLQPAAPRILRSVSAYVSGADGDTDEFWRTVAAAQSPSETARRARKPRRVHFRPNAGYITVFRQRDAAAAVHPPEVSAQSRKTAMVEPPSSSRKANTNPLADDHDAEPEALPPAAVCVTAPHVPLVSVTPEPNGDGDDDSSRGASQHDSESNRSHRRYPTIVGAVSSEDASPDGGFPVSAPATAVRLTSATDMTGTAATVTPASLILLHSADSASLLDPPRQLRGFLTSPSIRDTEKEKAFAASPSDAWSTAGSQSLDAGSPPSSLFRGVRRPTLRATLLPRPDVLSAPATGAQASA